MNESIKISVLIPCYNVEKYVDECISSVINQTLHDIEIICINDGSTDNTLSILEKYKSTDDRIKIINKTNTGYGDSMNNGIDIARGEYIGIVESDDFIEPEMFQSLYDTACKNNVQIARCCYYMYQNGNNKPVTNDFITKNKVLDPNIDTSVFWQVPSIWASIYKREWLNENNIRFLPTPGASYQDTSFSFKAYACCNRFIMISNPYLHYRIDNMNSSVNSKNKTYCVCDEWNEIYRFIVNDRKRFGHLLLIMPAIQTGTYRWNFRRLDTSDKKFKFAFHWTIEWITRFLRREISCRAIKNVIHCLKLRPGNCIRKVARAVVPDRAKPCIKAILHRIPQGIKDPVKRLLRW